MWHTIRITYYIILLYFLKTFLYKTASVLFYTSGMKENSLELDNYLLCTVLDLIGKIRTMNAVYEQIK